MRQWNCFCCTFKWAKANRLTNVKSRRERRELILRSLLPSCNDANTLGTDFHHANMTAAALRPLSMMLFTAPPLYAYICIFPTRVHLHTCTGRASGACCMHTTYSNALLNIKGNYPSPWCMDLSEFLNQRNGL